MRRATAEPADLFADAPELIRRYRFREWFGDYDETDPPDRFECYLAYGTYMSARCWWVARKLNLPLRDVHHMTRDDDAASSCGHRTGWRPSTTAASRRGTRRRPHRGVRGIRVCRSITREPASAIVATSDAATAAGHAATAASSPGTPTSSPASMKQSATPPKIV